MKRAIQIRPLDNVATLLVDADDEVVGVVGGDGTVAVRESVKNGHKVALADIRAGEAVVKYGVRIGWATRNIARGAWVHLHNCASDFDERSGTLDGETGAPTDTRYE